MPGIVFEVDHPSATGILLTLAAIAVKESGVSQPPVLENNAVVVRFETERQASFSLRRIRDILGDLCDMFHDRDEVFTFRCVLAPSDTRVQW